MRLLRKFSELLFGKQAVGAIENFTHQAQPSRAFYEKQKEYIAREAAVGARLLGPVPSGHKREFFCLDEHTWVWSESWRDENGRLQQLTVNYEVDPSGILKRVNGGQYTKVRGEELIRFNQAIKSYHKQVLAHVYGKPTATTA